MKPASRTVIFDIDGTLANIDHRRHLVEHDSKKWDEFFAKIPEDSPNYDIAELCNHLYAVNNRLVIVTGRFERDRKITVEWLAKHNIQYHTLLMRPNDNYEPDYVIKEHVLKDLQAQGANVWFVVDDRQSVVDMWRRNGITCLQCAEGNF
jgi:phosphoglycolate phosphatase-like HAD superfamily hydrolase